MATRNGNQSDMSTRITLVEVAADTAQWLRENSSSNLTINEMPGVEQLLTASSLGTLESDVILLGKQLEEPLSVCRRLTENNRDLQVIIRADDDDCARLTKQIDHNGQLADQVRVCAMRDRDDLPAMIKRAIKRARRRCSYRRHSSDGDGDAGGNTNAGVTAYLDNILDQAPIGMLTIDRQGGIKTLNKRARDMLGVSEADVLKTPIARLFDVADRDRLAALLDDGHLAQQKSEVPRRRRTETYFTLSAGDDEQRFVEVSASQYEGRNGQPGTMIILHDITTRVLAEQARIKATVALQVSEDRFLELADVLKLVPWESDPDNGVFTYIGDRAAETFGYPLAAWSEPGFWHTIIHPEDRAWAIAVCEENRRRLQNYDFEYRILAADGSIVWVHDLVNVMRDDTGHAVKLRGFMMDVSERKRAEAGPANRATG